MRLEQNLSVFQCGGILTGSPHVGIGRINSKTSIGHEASVLGLLIFGLLVLVIFLSGIMVYHIRRHNLRKQLVMMQTVRYIKASTDGTDEADDEISVDMAMNESNDTGNILRTTNQQIALSNGT